MIDEPNLYELIEKILQEKQQLFDELNKFQERLKTMEKRINHLVEVVLVSGK